MFFLSAIKIGKSTAQIYRKKYKFFEFKNKLFISKLFYIKKLIKIDYLNKTRKQ